MTDPKGNKDKTVLVVDDEVFVLEIVEAFVEQLGHKVLLANSGHEALKIVREYEGKVDLLLTDVIMPNMNGLELAETVVTDNPDVKVIFMSGCLQPAINSRNTPLFGNGFIQKPFSAKTITTHVKKALKEMA